MCSATITPIYYWCFQRTGNFSFIILWMRNYFHNLYLGKWSMRSYNFSLDLYCSLLFHKNFFFGACIVILPACTESRLIYSIYSYRYLWNTNFKTFNLPIAFDLSLKDFSRRCYEPFDPLVLYVLHYAELIIRTRGWSVSEFSGMFHSWIE